jgi:hypothetical protein
MLIKASLFPLPEMGGGKKNPVVILLCLPTAEIM